MFTATSEFSSLPEGAKSARQNAGNIIPMVLVTTADGGTAIEGISYDRLKEDMRDAERDLKKKLETVDVLGSGSTEPDATTAELEADAPTAPAMLSEARAWTNAGGKEITAAVKSVAGGNVVFVMDGREISYPLSNLSAASRAEIERLAGE